MHARPSLSAQRSSASALAPFMSDLNPPSQNKPGLLPSRVRTAMVLFGEDSTSRVTRRASFMVDSMDAAETALSCPLDTHDARGKRCPYRLRSLYLLIHIASFSELTR